jgi:hypothetical protein
MPRTIKVSYAAGGWGGPAPPTDYVTRRLLRYEPRIDLRQGLASPAPLWRSSQNRNHTIYKKAIAGFGIPLEDARVKPSAAFRLEPDDAWHLFN